MEFKLTITVEELESVMDPIVGLFPSRFLWKLNQNGQSESEKSISSWDLHCCCTTEYLYITNTTYRLWSHSYLLFIFLFKEKKYCLFSFYLFRFFPPKKHEFKFLLHFILKSWTDKIGFFSQLALFFTYLFISVTNIYFFDSIYFRKNT